MSDLTLVTNGVRNGVFYGLVTGAATQPDITGACGDFTMTGIKVSQSADGWTITAPIPMEALNDGMCVFVFTDRQSGAEIGHVALSVGEALADDLRAEVALLREELDLLKRAFRRHFNETSAS